MIYGNMVMASALGEWLEQEFRRRQWDTLQKASDALDIPVQTIHDLLRKPKKSPRPETMRKLADGLKVSLEQLFDRAGLPPLSDTPTESRATPESVRGLSEASYAFLSQLKPDELERFLALWQEQRNHGPQ